MNYSNPTLRNVFNNTKVHRKPITGIVSDYHELPYILITPAETDHTSSIKITGKIKVSPKLILSSATLSESFGDIFDEETFDSEITGRVFSFAHAKKRNLKVESEDFTIKEISYSADNSLEREIDKLAMSEELKTAIIFGPSYKYYPISIDKFINEILDREFRI